MSGKRNDNIEAIHPLTQKLVRMLDQLDRLIEERAYGKAYYKMLIILSNLRQTPEVTELSNEITKTIQYIQSVNGINNIQVASRQIKRGTRKWGKTGFDTKIKLTSLLWDEGYLTHEAYGGAALDLKDLRDVVGKEKVYNR